MSIDYVFMRNDEYLAVERGWTADLDEALVINTAHPYRLMSLIRMRMAIVPKPVVDGERVVYLYSEHLPVTGYTRDEYPYKDFDAVWPTFTPKFASGLGAEDKLPMEGDAEPMALGGFLELFSADGYDREFLEECFHTIHKNQRKGFLWSVKSLKEFVELEGR